MIDLDLCAALAGPPREVGRIYGVVIGVVTANKSDDKDKDGLVQVRFPWLLEDPQQKEAVSNWARVISPMAGNERGLYLLPEIDDEVLVAFEHGDVSCPYVLGSLWNGKDRPPVKEKEEEKSNVRILKSKSGHVVRLDDTEDKEKIEIVDAKGKQSLVFDTAAGTITITADKDVVIESKEGTVKINGKKGVEITAQDGPARLETKKGNVDIKAEAEVNVKGTKVNLN